MLVRDSGDTDCNDLAHDTSRDCLHGASSPSNGCSAVHSEHEAVARDMDRVCVRGMHQCLPSRVNQHRAALSTVLTCLMSLHSHRAHACIECHKMSLPRLENS